MISMLLQPEWITQASDFIAQNWTKLLGIVGGTGGIVAIITLIGKIIIVCVQGHIAKKNNKPVQTIFTELISEIEAKINDLKEWVQVQGDEIEEKIRKNLTKEFEKTLEKAQRIKLSIYDKYVKDEEKAKQILNELDSSVAKTESYLRTVREQNKDTALQMPVEEDKGALQNTVVESPKKKKVKVIVER